MKGPTGIIESNSCLTMGQLMHREILRLPAGLPGTNCPYFYVQICQKRTRNSPRCIMANKHPSCTGSAPHASHSVNIIPPGDPLLHTVRTKSKAQCHATEPHLSPPGAINSIPRELHPITEKATCGKDQLLSDTHPAAALT